jgi:hypothetical protein
MIVRIKYLILLTLRKKTACKLKFFEDPISAEIKGTQPIKKKILPDRFLPTGLCFLEVKIFKRCRRNSSVKVLQKDVYQKFNFSAQKIKKIYLLYKILRSKA